MSFVAVIDKDRHKYIWSKAITSLASISESIKFIVSPKSLSISSVNTAKTSSGEVIFSSSFFHEFRADFDDEDNIIEGFQIEKETPSYSFIINSKHLLILFKNLDIFDLDYICLKIHWINDAVEPNFSSLKYKLLIEIRTKKLILKKFQTGYQPVVSNRITISEEYNKELKKSNASYNFLHYIKIEQAILKQFLDMIPSATEDFKIEIKNENIQFSGFTKQIMKDREYLKQPMSVAISVYLEELLDTNLNINVANRPSIESIMFRLKDFKNFINFITSFSNGNINNDSSDSSDDYFEIIYKRPGDPVLFELKNNQHLTVQYIQITNGTDIEGANKVGGGGGGASNPLKSHVLYKIENAPEQTRDVSRSAKRSKKNTLRSSDDVGSQQLFVPELSQQHGTEPSTPGFSYGNALEDTEYEESEREGDPEGKQEVEDEHENEHEYQGEHDLEFGPTQGATLPKSIFD
ncbi:putative DNA repair protein rad9 [[Candida] railenensis]|uniref:DNA repair protein rad9 n=1 Tax=[Candida] railenensis TaxID=45579 RepID=A0A9P0QR38_9ASCO|nr:putative DNA repair protein rad9 [[Candida] railenensis]